MGRIASMVTSISRSKTWKIPNAMPNARPMAPPIMSPAKAEIRVSRPARRRAARLRWHSAARANRFADGSRAPTFRAPPAPRPAAAMPWRAPGSSLRRLDEIEQFAAQPQEFRIFPRRQLIALPRQIDRKFDADAAGMRQQADAAVAWR